MSARAARLQADEAAERLAKLDDWEIRDGRLHREYEFASFAEAFGFMASAAIHAQELDHHPDWCNTYNRVTVDLSSHDVGGLSDRDFELAKRMDALTAARRARP